MVHRLAAVARGLDEHPQVFPRRLLPDELAERLGPQRDVRVLRLALGGEGGVIGHSGSTSVKRFERHNHQNVDPPIVPKRHDQNNPTRSSQ